MTPSPERTKDGGIVGPRPRGGLWLAPLGVILLGSCLTAALTGRIWWDARTVEAFAFEKSVADLVSVLERGIDQNVEKTAAIADYIQADGPPNRAEFTRLVEPTLRRMPILHALSWVPRITADEREAFEQYGGFDRQHPDPPVRLVQLSAEGELVPAERREVYYPGIYLVPTPLMQLEGNIFDTGSEPSRLRTIQRAIDTGQMAATPPVHLIQDRDGRKGFILFAPVYAAGEGEGPKGPERRVLGLAAAGFFADVLVERALDSLGYREMMLVTLHDVTGDQPAASLYSYENPTADSAADPTADPTTAPTADSTSWFDADAVTALEPAPYRAAVRREMRVGGRIWEVVATPTTRAVATLAGNTAAVWGTAVAGLLLTGLMAFIVFSAMQHHDRLAGVAIERSRINRALEASIAEHQAAETALAARNVQLERLNEEMEQFVSSVSHDLKTPLVAADMMMHYLDRTLEDGERDEAMIAVGHIRASCAHMRRLIDDLIEHSRAGWRAMPDEPVDLGELALEVVENHASGGGKDGMHIQVQPDMPTLRGDRGRMSALLSNLVGNAIKYGGTTTGARVHIGCTTGRAPSGERELWLFVSDTGPGVPTEFRKVIFDVFRRLSGDEDGTGIGLAIVQRVAVAHGGRAWVDATTAEDVAKNGAKSTGSTFWVALPWDRILHADGDRRAAHATSSFNRS